MKKNYIFKTIKIAIVIFAIALSFTRANAQTTNVNAVITAGVPTEFDDGETYQSYLVDQVITMTATATVDGIGTFDVSFDVTPLSGQRVVRSATIWGVNPEFADVDVDGVLVPTATNEGPVFRARANGQSFTSIGNITFSNYTGGLSASNITSYTFTDIEVAGANNKFDKFVYQVDGTEYNVGKLTSNPATVNLLTAGPVDIAEGAALTSLTAFDIRILSDRSANTDAWSVQSITLNVDVDYTILSTETISINDTSLKIFPTVTDGVFSVNKAFKTLQLYDLTGKIVKTFSSTDALEVTGLNQGLYIVKIQSEKGTISTRKMIIK
jgi:hypothetical protein